MCFNELLYMTCTYVVQGFMAEPRVLPEGKGCSINLCLWFYIISKHTK